jgi:endonuclease IV
MFGSHLSVAGGMHDALDAAEKLGLELVQVFTGN